MPKITMDGKYMKAENIKDAGEKVVTIKYVPETKQNVAQEGEPEDNKWVVYFEESDAGLPLTPTRFSQLVGIFGSNNTDDWLGKKVTLYYDPEVRFAGKKVGGVRIKAYQEESKLFPKGMKV